MPQLQQEKAIFWNWLGDAPAKRPRLTGQKSVIWNVTMDDSSVVLGNVELLPHPGAKAEWMHPGDAESLAPSGG